MEWYIYPKQEFARFEEQWNDLHINYYNSHPLLDLDFVKPLLKYFSNNNVYIAVEGMPNNINTIAIIEKKGMGIWETFSPGQLPITLILSKSDHFNIKQFQSLIKNIKGAMLGIINYDSLYLPHIDEGIVETVKCFYTISIEIKDNFNTFWSQRTKRIRKNIAQKIKLLEKDNLSYKINITTASDKMEKAVEKYGNIESMGWKGSSGSAINIKNIQGKFYSEVMKKFAEKNSSHVFELIVNDKLVASRLCISSKNMIIILKTTYDESYSKYGPGRLLLFLTIKNIFDDSKFKLLEFYTNANNEQLKWGSNKRLLCIYNVYRNNLLRNTIQKTKKIRNFIK